MEDSNLKRLGKIVQLAKRGVDGEKEMALRIVRQICKRHNLNFDDVMRDITTQEFTLQYKRGDKQLAVQVILRYGLMDIDSDMSGSDRYRQIWFTTTKEKFVEVQSAYAILSRLYRKDLKKTTEAFAMAFWYRHDLFYKPTPEEQLKHTRRLNKKAKEKTEKEKQEEQERLKRAANIMKDLEEANIYKSLKSGK